MPDQLPPNPTPARPPFRLRNWLRRWRQLGWRNRAMLIEALILLGLARAIIIFIPFKRVAPHLGQAQHATSTASLTPAIMHTARRIAYAIHLVSRHTPWTSNCFPQALAGHIMLRRRRIPNTLYLGVYKDRTTFSAHAWLRHSDLVVTGGPGHERYAIIAHYGWQPTSPPLPPVESA